MGRSVLQQRYDLSLRQFFSLRHGEMQKFQGKNNPGVRAVVIRLSDRGMTTRQIQNRLSDDHWKISRSTIARIVHGPVPSGMPKPYKPRTLTETQYSMLMVDFDGILEKENTYTAKDLIRIAKGKGIKVRYRNLPIVVCFLCHFFRDFNMANSEDILEWKNDFSILWVP